jgi:hypothetical protein
VLEEPDIEIGAGVSSKGKQLLSSNVFPAANCSQLSVGVSLLTYLVAATVAASTTTVVVVVVAVATSTAATSTSRTAQRSASKTNNNSSMTLGMPPRVSTSLLSHPRCQVLDSSFLDSHHDFRVRKRSITYDNNSEYLHFFRPAQLYSGLFIR